MRLGDTGGAAGALSRFMGVYDVKNSKSWRLDDVEHRDQETQRRTEQIKRRFDWRREDIERTRRTHKLANERRMLDARLYQLLEISKISIMITIFSRQTYVESHFPDRTSGTLVFAQGTTSVLSMVCMMLVMMRCCIIMLSTMRFASEVLESHLKLVHVDQIDLVSPFNQWWRIEWEHYWVRTYHIFRAGIALLFVALALTNAALYKWTWFSVGSLTFLAILFWQWRIEGKWRKAAYYPTKYDLPPVSEATTTLSTHANAGSTTHLN
ncbi:Aste57867_13692 [Aphanomyces stellatus]|uniref:Aste57867_13692 protein n=1 Tax=Aphanomyces stellatus TaxID=120398 RepID=A0A485KZ18_9STRA|nr:hypothetical protein As57867_013642 [Aphanomyces stellatus]VFT90525.1 Aste57867_13692 [Aphanomyces stellatus]